MSLTGERMEDIAEGILTKREVTLETEEERLFHEKVGKEMAEMKARGITPEFPNEWSDFPTEEEIRDA